MSTHAIGAYTLLICYAWGADPACSIPDDDGRLARIVRMSPKGWKSVREEVLAAWELREDGRYYQSTLEEERSHARSRSEKGRKGAAARHRSSGSSSAQATLEQCSSSVQAQLGACHARLTSSFSAVKAVKKGGMGGSEDIYAEKNAQRLADEADAKRKGFTGPPPELKAKIEADRRRKGGAS